MSSFKLLVISSAALLSVLSSAAVSAQLPEKCLQLPVKGECKAMIEKFYFNQKTGRCTPYFYDGCGPVVPFESMEECRALCEPPKAEPAPAKRTGGITRDPIEHDPRYADIFRQIDDEVKGILANHPSKGAMGFVHVFWDTKKRVLKQKYKIDWKSPAEMNPHIMFD